MEEDPQTRMDSSPLDARIEALLFASGGALKRATLSRLLSVSPEEVAAGIEVLKTRLTGGLTLIEADEALALVTAPAVAETVASIRKKDWEGELGQAGLEVIAIVLHRKEATRSSIDYIRGVNSAATMRILQTKGLIERASGKGVGEGEVTYQATPALLAHLGITHVSDIPNHAATLAELEQFENRDREAQPGQKDTEDDTDIAYDENDDEPTA